MYVALGRHTLIPVFIMVVCQIPVYLGLCIVWKTLRGRPPPVEGKTNGSLPADNVEEMEDHQGDEDIVDDKEEHTDVVEKPVFIITPL